MKNRTVQRLSCAAAIVAATAFSCGNFTGRSPAVEPAISTRALAGNKRVLEFNPIGSGLNRRKNSAKAFVFAGSNGERLYRVAREDLFSGPFKNIEIRADAEVEASLDSEKRQVVITAKRSGGTEQCLVSTKGMENASIVAAQGYYGLKFYVVETTPQGAPITEGSHFRAREIDVSFSTLVTVSSSGIGRNESSRLARLEGMQVVYRDVLVPSRR